MKAFNTENVKDHYRSGKDILSDDFFIPCLKYSKKYRRAVAYFSTNALLEWSDIVNDILYNNIEINLLLSPNLSKEDLEILKDLSDKEKIEYIKKYSEKYFEELDDYRRRGKLKKWRVEFFSWLIANGNMNLKFAFPEGDDFGALFHEKIGVFDLVNDEKIAFTGSANETSGGYKRNYESIDVYRSWVGTEVNRVKTKENQFDEAWENTAKGLIVSKPSAEVLEKIKSYSENFENPPGKPIANEPKTKYSTDKKTLADTLWPNQKSAFHKFLKEKSGILEMATGTGKTRTAISIMEHLFLKDKINGAIITVEGGDLLKQWQDEIDDWNYRNQYNLKIFGHYDQNKDLMKFKRNPNNSILLLSRHQLDKLFFQDFKENSNSLMIIHDEVHGFGSPGHVEKLDGSHKIFSYKLGLSATPDREYDQEGNEFIEKEIGPIIFSFDLEDAIKENILCEFDYEPMIYEISDSDKKRIQGVYTKYRMKDKEGVSYRKTDLYRDLAMVYKTAENKVLAFEELVKSNPTMLKSCIIFTATIAYAQEFLPIIQDNTYKYRTYFSGDDEYHLIEFAKGEIDCLITCHKLSQGINIPSLKNVVLISSDRAKLETIQRIGRCLRKDSSNPNKTAKVYDFIGTRENNLLDADKERMEWLTELSETKNKING